MRNKMIFIIVFLSAIGGVSALPNIFGNTSKSKAAVYRPYKFTARDQAELVVTKFIKAIEKGDIRTMALLIEKDANYNTACKIVAEFYSKHCQGKAIKYLILYPREFIFSDSIVVMHFDIKNTTKPNENKEALLFLVNKENQWLIKTSSSFFKVLNLLNGKTKKEKER